MISKIIKIILLIFLTILIVLNPGCSVFKNAGSDLGSGLTDELKSNADTIGSEFVKGMVSSLASDSSKQKLTKFIDSLITNMGYTTNQQLVGIRDSLLNDYVNRWVQSIIEDAIGNTTRQKLGYLRDELLGDKTIMHLLNIRNSFFNYYLQQYLSEIEKSIGPNVLNDSTMQKISTIRDTLIGTKTNTLIKSIVDSAMVTVASRFNKDILKNDMNFLEKNATWLFSLIGFIVIMIIWFVWRMKEKYLKLSKLLTVQIADVGEKNVFESLKENISKHAKVLGIEDDLRELLNKEGLLHKV